MDCALAGAETHHGRPLNRIVRHHVPLRIAAAIVGTLFLLALMFVWFAVDNAKAGIIEVLAFGMLGAYAYAAFPGIFPGQKRWDDLNRDIAAKGAGGDGAGEGPRKE